MARNNLFSDFKDSGSTCSQSAGVRGERIFGRPLCGPPQVREGDHAFSGSHQGGDALWSMSWSRRIGAPDASLTAVSGIAAVSELCDRLGVVEALDGAVGSIKARARGHSAGALPVGLATAGNHGDIPRSHFAPAPPCPKAVPLGSNGHTSRAGGAFLERRSPRGLGTATVLGGPGRVRGTDSVTVPNWAAAAPPLHQLALRLVTEPGPGVG